MPIDDVLTETTDVASLRQQQARAEVQEEMAQQPQSRSSTGAVVQVGKADLQLLVDTATLVVLVLILMRL